MSKGVIPIPITAKLGGKVIHIDGGDFTGKTTVCKMLTRYFRNLELKTQFRFQPGATELGKDLRKLIFKMPYSNDMGRVAERLLFSADHAEFISEMLEADGDILTICDRYNPISNMVFGHFALNIPLDVMKQVNDIARTYVSPEGETPPYKAPDMFIVMTATNETVAKRRAARMAENGEIQKFDDEGDEFTRNVLDGYERIIQSPRHYGFDYLLDVPTAKIETDEKTVDQVFAETLEAIQKAFNIDDAELPAAVFSLSACTNCNVCTDFEKVTAPNSYLSDSFSYFKCLYNRCNTLLTEKGFKNQIEPEQVLSRTYSECGELINVFKKEPDNIEEIGDELSDVIIYLFNTIIRLNEVSKGNFMKHLEEIACKMMIYKDDEGENTWALLNKLSRTVAKVEETMDALDYMYPDSVMNYNAVHRFNEVFMAAIDIAHHFEIDLFYEIDKKMRKNMQRPYRYNTAPKHFIEEGETSA